MNHASPYAFPIFRRIGAFYPLVVRDAWFSWGSSNSPVPTNHVRIHYFRPDGNYLGWTVYAFGDTTEDTSNFNGVIHKGNVKDLGPNEFLDPATQGIEYWQLSGSNVLHTTQQVTFQNPALVGLNLRLHPVQQHSADPIVGQSSFNSQSGTVMVPALTTTVFVTSKP